MTVFTWVVLALLISINGLYVAAEFAVVSVRRSRVRQLAEEGSARAMELLPRLEESARLDRFVAACQVGITISSLVVGAYGQAKLGAALAPLFAQWGDMQEVAAQSASVVAVLLGLTVLQMVFGELVPKSLALQYPTKVALLTVLPMRWSERLLAWFVAVLNGSAWALLRLLGMEPTSHHHLHSPEEIRFLIAESREGGYLRPEEQRRLNHALGLTQRTASELMVPRTRVVGLDADLDVEGAAAAAAAAPFTRFPVYQGSLDDVVGVVHAKDLALGRLGTGGNAPLTSLLRPVLAVHERLTADRVLSLMREQHGVLALVVDDFGGTSGIVTAEDILTELLGEVGDEFKGGSGPAPRRLADGSVRLPGELALYESERWVSARWEAEDADTVGGLVSERLGRLARVGDRLEIEGARVEVERVERRAIQSVRVWPAPPAEEGGPA